MAKSVSENRYIRLTTFTADGRRKHTPVWIALWKDGVIGTTTDDDSWKVRRLRKTPNVEIAPSDSKGQVDEAGVTRTGTAEAVPVSDPDYEILEAALLRKYGLQYRLFRFIRKLRGKTACAIAIRLN
jgi:PPOX class probable F420-dependent enzyme